MRCIILVLFSSGLIARGRAASAPHDYVVLPNATNAIQFRLYTNAAHCFNTFSLTAFGEPLLPNPGDEALPIGRTPSSADPARQSLWVDGLGAELFVTNGMTLLEQAAGPDWSYLAVDVTPAYRGRLEQYRRGILYVAPDLFVLHDQVVAKQPVNLQWRLHPPLATQVDPIWHDLRLDLPQVRLRISAPSRRELRSWERVLSPTDELLPGTMTVQVGPTNKVSRLDFLTVFAIQPGGQKMDYVFKLVESNTAVGARIQRDGLPTLVAFRLAPTNAVASLDGFKFTGPVGVSVFRPKRNTP